MITTDSIQPFLFEQVNIRGYIINLSSSFQTIISQRNYPLPVQKLLGEAMLSALFLAANIKFEGKLSMQFQGEDPLSLLVVQCDNLLNIRAMAKYLDREDPEDYNSAFLNGKLSLTLSTPNNPGYQSIVPLSSSFMSENLMHYLSQSEQITTQVWMATSEKHAGGMMLQLMPDKNTQQEQFWEYALAIGQTIQEKELLELDSQILLHRLFHEVDLRVFDKRTVNFNCSCSENKMKNVILMLGEKEVKQILTEQERLEINCDFCNQGYSFDAVDIAAIFHPKNFARNEYYDPKIEILKEFKTTKSKKK